MADIYPQMNNSSGKSPLLFYVSKKSFSPLCVRKGRGRHWMAKISSAVQAVSPFTVAVQAPMPTGPGAS